MPQISFIAPALITLGVLSAIVPIIIHFSINKKPQDVPFPAFRFLQKTKITGRIFRVKQWLLLLLRILLLLFFSMALARPKLYSTWFSSDTPTRVTNAIILLDDTLSMSYKEAGKSRFEFAQEKALTLLDQLEPPSKICLYPLSRGPGQFTIDFESIRTEIKRLQCTTLSASAQDGLFASKTLLEELGEQKGDIFLVSDLTQKNFPSLSSSPLSFAPFKVHLETIGHGKPQNAGVAEVEIPSKNIPQGGILYLTCKIFSLGPVATQREVALYIGDEKKFQKRLDLPGQGETIDVEFTQKLDLSGIVHGKIVLEGEDAILADNTFFFTVRVLPPLHIGILAEPEDFETFRPAFLLMNILSPKGLRFEQQFVLQKITPEQFTQTDLKNTHLLFLLTLPEEGVLALNRLKEVLEIGGSLVFFGQSDSVLNSLFPPLGELVPGPVSFESEGRHFLAPFKTGKYGDLSQPILSQYRQILSEENANEEVLLYFKNRSPAVTYRRSGVGGIIYLAFPLSLEPQSLATTPVVIPFFHFMLRSLLTQYPPIPQVSSRDAVSFQLRQMELNAEIKWLRPDSSKLEKVPLPVASDRILLEETQTPGHYDVFIKSQQELRKEGFSVNIAEEEKDLRQVDLEELKKYLGEQKATAPDEPQKTENSPKKASEKEVYAYLMLFLLALFSLESFFSNRM